MILTILCEVLLSLGLWIMVDMLVFNFVFLRLVAWNWVTGRLAHNQFEHTAQSADHNRQQQQDCRKGE